MRRLINYKKNLVACFCTTIGHSLRRTLVLFINYSAIISRKDAKDTERRKENLHYRFAPLREAFNFSLRLCVFVVEFKISTTGYFPQQ